MECLPASGKPIKVVALGGSVTVGHGPENKQTAWLYRVFSWFNETFPHPDHHFINEAIPAVTSSYIAPCVFNMVPADTDLIIMVCPLFIFQCLLTNVLFWRLNNGTDLRVLCRSSHSTTQNERDPIIWKNPLGEEFLFRVTVFCSMLLLPHLKPRPGCWH